MRNSYYIGINNYVPDPYMWLDLLPDETVHHYIDRLKNKALKLNGNLKDSIWFAELHTDLKVRYFSNDIDSIDNIKANFNEVLVEKKYNYYIDSIKFTLDNGMQTVLFKQTHDRHYYLLGIDSFFSNYLNQPVKYNAKYFELFTGNHMMIFSIENNCQAVNYTFFDSNIGIFNFDNKEKFRLFLLAYLKEHEQAYKIPKNENGNYKLMIAAYKNSDDIKQQLIYLSIKQQDIAITATKIIFENQQKITRLFIVNENLLYNVSIEFVNVDFYNQLVLVKLSYLHNNEKVIKNVIINQLSVDKILNIIHEEYQEILNSDKISTLIESEQNIISYYDIDTIPDHLSEIKNQKKSPYLIKKVDDFIFVEHGNTNDQNSHVTGDSQLLADSALSRQHTVIIQIQDDITVADAVTKLKNKHPTQTTIIYFDISTSFAPIKKRSIFKFNSA